jgi:hypothetical protein
MILNIKIQPYFKATIIALILLAGQASAQGIARDSLSNYAGIWVGFSFPDSSNLKPKSTAHLVWRIHHVDTIKNEIEITQTGQRFDDASEIENPKKEIYKMHFDSLGFSIVLKGGLPNSKYKLSLSHSKFSDLKAMKGVFERSDQEETSSPFIFAKISDDTSDYVKPIGKVEVVVSPPPPIK